MDAKAELRHTALQRDEDGIAWLHLDQADARVNTLSAEVIGELESIVSGLEEAPPRGLVILSDKPGFLAGADIRAFDEIRDREQAGNFIRRGQALMDRIEALPLPTVALIRGHCLGGGLELALACRYRIAERGPTTRIGLPEVRLGIHPGFGGTVRANRLLGPFAALNLMLSGKSLDAGQARKAGLVDYALPERQLLRAARRLILEAPPARTPARWHRLVNHRWVRPVVAAAMARMVARRARPEHYPAPAALINVWREHGDNERLMQQAEARSVARLVTGRASRNLVRAFHLQERLKSLAQGEADVTRVHVIGAGRMGGDIAAWCALQGLQVTLQDRTPQQIGPAIRRAHSLFARRLREPHRVMAAMDRLLPDARGLGLSRADLVIEAVFEDVQVKQALLHSVESQLAEGALLASNTSSIPLETLGEALARPERLVGLHFFNPVARMPLVEVVQGAATDAGALARATAFVGAIDRLPLPVKSAPGFLVNRILMPYLLEAMHLVEEGVPVSVIDRAALQYGMPMGPLRLADSVGLDVCYSVAQLLAVPAGTEVPRRLERMVEEGWLGQKSGRGFYRYPGGRAVAPFERPWIRQNGDLVRDRLLFSLLQASIHTLEDGVVADADLLDAGLLFGAGFPPFRGGPMHYLNQSDPEALQARINALGERFAPLAWNGSTVELGTAAASG